MNYKFSENQGMNEGYINWNGYWRNG